jgi:hypothetical protein
LSQNKRKAGADIELSNMMMTMAMICLLLGSDYKTGSYTTAIPKYWLCKQGPVFSVQSE